MMINKEKTKEWIDLYLEHIDKIGSEVHVTEEEGYKFRAVDTFQKNFNIDAPDLAEMLENAIEDNNLVAGYMYLPKRVLITFARESEAETRGALRKLFDNTLAIRTRINDAEDTFDGLMKLRNEARNENHINYIGIRFLSLLLGFRFPDLWSALKPREWSLFCKYIDEDFSIPNRTSIGERYEIYSKYIDALRETLKTMPEIQKLRDQLTRGLEFTDLEFRWMAQDVIYVTARLIADERSHKTITNLDDEDASQDERKEEVIAHHIITEMQFPLEAYLEDFIVRNWDNIDFGEKLNLYYDEDGSPGQQLTTDVGIIDVLAKDQSGDFVVIELKRDSSRYDVVGQILSYITWVKNNLATKKERVRGLIIVNRGTPALHAAVEAVRDIVSVKYYRVKLDLIEPDDRD
ncbi:MAG: endonuclease NucS [Candidatus Colwellbacteria bacterium]|nr:endonuclease NucS [Candidatus Colwellbacteria bacterium]